jgi:hypothetical protein
MPIRTFTGIAKNRPERALQLLLFQRRIESFVAAKTNVYQSVTTQMLRRSRTIPSTEGFGYAGLVRTYYGI